MAELAPALALRLLLCFALGSIPFAVVAMAGTGIDIRQFGSGNPGFNNVLRYSRWRAALTLAGDAGKGLAGVWLCTRPGDPAALAWACGLAAVLGHCYSPWLKFRGGKGIATAAGVMLWLYPAWAALAFALYALLRRIGSRRQWTESAALSSLSTCAVFVALLAAFESREAALCGAGLLAFILWRHKNNLLALSGGAQ